MIERILALMKEKNLTPSAFADEIGIQRSGMSHLISGRNKPSLEFIMKVLKRFPDVKSEYLLYGITNGKVIPTEEKSENAEILPKVTATLFDQPEVAESKPESKPQRQLKRS
jgi:transcriptional regulator with XRE-family HTH domain